MKEIMEFLKQRRNVKYSVWMIIFGLIFAFSFQANRVQISQIFEPPIRIVPGTKEARQYQVFGWQGVWAKGKKSILKVAFPRKKTYQMVIKAFSCSPPDARDQRIEVHFNNVALDRLKFRKTPKWQKFSVNIPSYLIKEANTIKFIYTQDTRLSPIAFDYLEFRNYIFRIKGFYLLFDFLVTRQINYLTFQILSCSLSFAFLLLLFWLLYSRFLSFAVRMKFSQAAKIDFWSYFPSIILLSLLALISFFSPYHFIYSFKAFFVVALAPTTVLKLFPYRNLSLRSIIEPSKPVFRFILRDIEKTCLEIKRAYFACLSFFSFLKKQIITFKRFLIRYHKANLSSALILDFMFLLILCAFLLKMKESVPTWIVDQIASLAYLLLVIGVVITFIQLTRKEKTGDEKRFIRIRKRWIIPFQGLILRIAERGKVPFQGLILRIAERGKVSFQRLILRIAERGKVPFQRLILRIKKRWKVSFKKRWEVPFKKIILGLVSILLVSLFLWLILPGKGVEVTQLIPQETFTFLILKIDLEDPGASELINNFDWWIRWGVRLLGPVEIAALATPAVSKEEPDYLFLVKNSRLIKIARLFRRSIDKAMISEKPFKKSEHKTCQILHVERPRHPNNVSSYTLFRDIGLFSNNPSLLKASLDQCGKETSFISGEALSNFRELQTSGEALFFINNSYSELSRALKSLEEKSVYAILPTVDSLNYLGGYFDILDADSLKGSLRFKYRDTVDIEKGREDVYFLAGLLKRFGKANGLNLEDEIIANSHYLRLNFKVSGLKSFISDLLAREKKQKRKK